MRRDLRLLNGLIFEFTCPRTIVLTTPNIEYNVKFEDLQAGPFRHKDHRFEWTRNEFQSWASDVAKRFGYAVEFHPIGPEAEGVGPPNTNGSLYSKPQACYQMKDDSTERRVSYQADLTEPQGILIVISYQ